jgi:hypothetical protein
MRNDRVIMFARFLFFSFILGRPSHLLPASTHIHILYLFVLLQTCFSLSRKSALEPMSRFRHIRSVVDSRPKVAVKHDNFRKKYNRAGLFFSFYYLFTSSQS